MIECEGCRQVVSGDLNSHECPSVHNEHFFHGILLVIAFLVAALGLLSSGCTNPEEEARLEAESKANWAFIGCMNSDKVIKTCAKKKPFPIQLECMSSKCGRPNAKWTTVEFR